MTNEPKAGKGIDPELLAAYIDRRLSPEQIVEVEARLASDPDAYALLVDAMRTLDGLQSADAVPMPSPSRRRPRSAWTIGGAAMAAAAASVIVGIAVWRGGLVAPAQDSPQFQRLVAASANDRTLQGRLSGGFHHAPIREVTRSSGDLSQQNLSVLAAAGELQRRAETSEDPSANLEWGVAQLIVGQIDAGTKTIESAIAQGLETPRAYNDAAVAHLALGFGGKAESFATALEFASRAVRKDPQLAEASFNRALALESLSLRDQAISEWQRFLTIEPDAAWREEAARRLQALQSAKQSSSLRNLSLDVISSLDDAGRSILVEQDPAALRTALEGPVLMEAIRNRSFADASSPVIAAVTSTAEQLQRRTGDRMTKDIWVHAVASKDRELIHRGIEKFLEGRDLLRRSDVTNARREFIAADRDLRAAGSPAAVWSSFFIAHTAFYAGETVEAATRVDALLGDTLSANYRAVGGRLYYLRTLCHLRFGQFAAMVSSATRAVELTANVGDLVMEISARSELADAFDRLAMNKEAWRERVSLLGRAFILDDPVVSHISLAAASRSALSSGNAFAADAFAEAMSANAALWKHPAAAAEARLRLADIALRRSETDRAVQLLLEADEFLDQSPDSAAVDSARLELLLLRGAAVAERQPEEAVAASKLAFDLLARQQSPYRLARAKLNYGKAIAHSNPSAARGEFIDGLRASYGDKSELDPFGRSMADQRWALLLQLLQLPASEDDLLNDVLAVLTVEPAQSELPTIRESMRDGDVLLVFVALDSELQTWRATRTAIERTSHPITRKQLEKLIAAHEQSLRDIRSTRWRENVADLSSLLLGSLADIRAQRLFLVGDALVSRVAFSALPYPGTADYVGDVADLVWLSSRLSAARPAVASSEALVIGDPSSPLGIRLPALPGARREAADVAGLHPNSILLLGADATLRSFRELAPRAAVLHYAGHAVGSQTDPGVSRLLLAGRDGDLTAADVAKLRIAARVVVLGACESAAPAVAGNAATFGLAKAFLQAGAQSVVAARWQVADQSSTELLIDFHRHLVHGATPTAALRNAQRDLRRKSRYDHPYYWAGFGVYADLRPISGGKS